MPKAGCNGYSLFAEQMKSSLETKTGKTLARINDLLREAAPYWSKLPEDEKQGWKERARDYKRSEDFALKKREVRFAQWEKSNRNFIYAKDNMDDNEHNDDSDLEDGADGQDPDVLDEFELPGPVSAPEKKVKDDFKFTLTSGGKFTWNTCMVPTEQGELRESLAPLVSSEDAENSKERRNPWRTADRRSGANAGAPSASIMTGPVSSRTYAASVRNSTYTQRNTPVSAPSKDGWTSAGGDYNSTQRNNNTCTYAYAKSTNRPYNAQKAIRKSERGSSRGSVMRTVRHVDTADNDDTTTPIRESLNQYPNNLPPRMQNRNGPSMTKNDQQQPPKYNSYYSRDVDEVDMIVDNNCTPTTSVTNSSQQRYELFKSEEYTTSFQSVVFENTRFQQQKPAVTTSVSTASSHNVQYVADVERLLSKPTGAILDSIRTDLPRIQLNPGLPPMRRLKKPTSVLELVENAKTMAELLIIDKSTDSSMVHRDIASLFV